MWYTDTGNRAQNSVIVHGMMVGYTMVYPIDIWIDFMKAYPPLKGTFHNVSYEINSFIWLKGFKVPISPFILP